MPARALSSVGSSRIASEMFGALRIADARSSLGCCARAFLDSEQRLLHDSPAAIAAAKLPQGDCFQIRVGVLTSSDKPFSAAAKASRQRFSAK
jgi:hypothetical protein